MDTVWKIGTVVLGSILFWNLIFAVAIVFFGRRDPRSVWAWLLLLFLLPGVGFVFYLFLGGNLHKRKMFRAKELEENLQELLQDQKSILRKKKSSSSAEITGYEDLVMYNMEAADALLLEENDIDIFTDGNRKFEALLADIERAEHFIHLQYYIIRNDVLFGHMLEALKRKAAEGVEVRILFDGMGCRGTGKRFWEKLRGEGLRTGEFFPAVFGRLQLRMNYRNHRKIAVIDNRVAYVGGFNIGREYVDLDSKFGHWRDTHLRIRGMGVIGLQLRFLLDWRYAAGEELLGCEKMFISPEPGTRDGCKLQVISSGPDNSLEQIRDNYLRLISKAESRIYIQTPYFIPDEAVLNALLIAVRSGVEVNLMIPCKPDHPFVYWATYSYAGQLLDAGANCYIYENGFLHAKSLVVDGRAFCCGTANLDIRSFALNFEVNVVVYSRRKAREMERLFLADIPHCTRLTRDAYAARRLKVRFMEQTCRLLSPLL